MLGSILSALNDVFQYVGATQMTGIPGAGDVYSSKLQEFMAFSRKKAGDFSLTNIYTVQFASPPMLTDKLEKGDDRLLLDYYVDSVTLPSKQVTTAQVMNVGSAYKYTTGNAFSQINMTFKMPKTQRTRAIFERWVSLMNNDQIPEPNLSCKNCAYSEQYAKLVCNPVKDDSEEIQGNLF